MHSKILRCISYILIFVFLLCGIPKGSLSISAVNVSDKSEFSSEYSEYLSGKNAAENDVRIPLSGYSAEETKVSFNDDAVFWEDGKGQISFSVEVQENALYNLELVWKASGSGVDPQLGLMIDGKYPFSDTKKIILNREWKNATENPRSDAQGNEYAQEQVETDSDIKTLISDYTGVVTEPYQFYLTAGTHLITLSEIGQGVYIKGLTLKAPEKVKPYSEVAKDYKTEKIDADIIVLEGENADIKNSKSIIPKSNNSDAGMTPSDPYTAKINYIGGTSWQSPQSKLTWNFKVEKDGYYYINMRYKQSDLVNGESLRWLKIDGKTPFEEAKSLKFSYDTAWNYYTLKADGNPCYIYLSKGEHTVSLEATLGRQAEYFYRLDKIVKTLGDEYIKIVMITSESPDLNRDYALFKQIPNFTETLTDCRDSLLVLSKDMKNNSGKDSTQAIASMENMARVLSNMLRSPYIAQQYVSDYYTNYTSLSSWLYDMTDMPLCLDRIQLVPYGKDYEDTNAGFFKKIIWGIIRLIASFTTDYNITDNSGEKNSVRLWVNWGQDQAAVLNSLIEDSFTPKSGIKVQLEIVNASLINGILAGNFPDLSLQMTRTEPVNLGIRGALYDLKQFSDYEQVLKRFQDGAEKPYEYENALYALPDTQSFYVMFYRTDIFEQLGLSVPETWEEFLYASTIIQRNNMSVYAPYTQITTSTTVNVGIGSLNLYPTLMSQNGLSLYNEKLNATALDKKQAIRVFENWTDFYTEYNFYKEADFYNRFRVGVMPLGIAPYNVYMTLYSAAPEIQGRWKVALVPGTKTEDGSVNHTVAGAGTGCSIIQKSDRKAEAWEFLKWWTSADTQSRYSNNVESILGTIGRIQTSNIEAFNKLAWDKDDVTVLNKQWALVDEIPEVPGSYYLTRAIDQAYWSVVNGQSSSKDAIVKWSQMADDEIERKIKEYS